MNEECNFCANSHDGVCGKCSAYNPDMKVSYFALKPEVNLNSLLLEVMMKRMDCKTLEMIVTGNSKIYLEVISHFKNIENLKKAANKYIMEKNHE
jgi:hypothetical protein